MRHRDRRGAAAAVPRAARRGRARSARVTGRRAGGPHLPAAVRLLRRPPRTPSGSSPPTSSPPTRAPASCTSLPASARTTSVCARRRASPSSARSTTGPASPPRSPTTPACRSSTPTAHHPRSEGAGACSSARTPTSTATPTAGAPTRRSSTRRSARGSCKVTAIKDRMLELNQQINWVPAHVRDGAFGKWLEGARDWSIRRNRFWGSPIPVWKSDDPRYPRIDVYGSARRARSATSACARPTCTARPSTSSSAPTPTTRPGGRRCAGSPTCSTAGSSPGRCPSPRSTTPSRPASGSSSTSRPTSSSSTSARPGAGSTPCTCWPPPCSTGRRSDTAWPTASCSATTAGRCRSGCGNYPDPDDHVRHVGGRRHALVPAVVARPAGRGPRSSTRRASSRRVRQVLNPIWNAWYFFIAVRQRRRHPRRRPHRRHRGARPLHPGQDRRSWSTTSPQRWTSTTCRGACAAITRFLDALNNWYIRRSRDRFWRHRRPAEVRAPTRPTPTTPCPRSS